MKRSWTDAVTDHFSYKLVALFITLILWLTILGRRDFVLSKKIDIELQTKPGQVVVAQTADNIRIKVSGPRAALKKFMDNPQSQSLLIDVSDRGEGVLDIDVPLNKIDVPLGVKILGVRPNVIRAEVAAKAGSTPEKTDVKKPDSKSTGRGTSQSTDSSADR